MPGTFSWPPMPGTEPEGRISSDPEAGAVDCAGAPPGVPTGFAVHICALRRMSSALCFPPAAADDAGVAVAGTDVLEGGGFDGLIGWP